MIGNSNDKTNFLHELLLPNRQVADLCKSFANNSSTDIKLSKTQLSKMIQSGGFLGRLLVPLLKAGLPLIKYVIKPLAKSFLIPLGLTAGASAADARIQKKILWSDKSPLDLGKQKTQIISNDEMEGITKIVKFLEDSSLLLKEQKGKFLSMLLDTLSASLLGY